MTHLRSLNEIAEDYVKLTLAVGLHDSRYVDAYYGPADWRESVEAERPGLDEIRARAEAAQTAIDPSSESGIDRQRAEFLSKQLGALVSWVSMLSGERMSFDEESRAMYDAIDEGRPDSYYAEIIEKLEALLPGPGALYDRFEHLRSKFMIPRERLEGVFCAAIDAARERTKQRISLPEHEDFRVEFVTGEVWGAYNGYKGNSHSLIQVNTDFATPIDQAVPLACHEGYPGHHVYNALLEVCLARGRNWVEFTVYPLYSPESLIAEGTAEYGIDLAFPEPDRLAFEREVLFPIAGLDEEGFDRYLTAKELSKGLARGGIDAGRRLLDGAATRAETIAWLAKFGPSSPPRAEQRVRFIEANRSYIVTYELGKELVRRYVESNAATTDARWQLFTEILSTPQTPSMLI